jgi:D-alanyl-D-alanine endopeptidase (penicillin-binding protein 7)
MTYFALSMHHIQRCIIVGVLFCISVCTALANELQQTEPLLRTPLSNNLNKSKQLRFLHGNTSGHDKALFQAVAYQSDQHPESNSKIRVKIRSPKAFEPVDSGNATLLLESSKALVYNQLSREVVYGKNTNQITSIASVTKLMTAMVMLDALLPMDAPITIAQEDIDYLKGTRSRLGVGVTLSRGELLQLALIASENRAASALARNYPGGFYAFIQAMNKKAQMLGMRSTYFADATGLDSANTSTAEDLVRMVSAAYAYPEIREVSTRASTEARLNGRKDVLNFNNTNALVKHADWHIGLSKTGFINEAGRCLVMQAEIAGQPMIIVLLDAVGKKNRLEDANRIRKWLEQKNTTFASNINS